VSLACWSYLIEEQGPHVLLKIVGVTAHLPWNLTALGGSMIGCAAPSPVVVSGALCGLDGEKAEALSTTCTIPGGGSQWSFWFSPMVQIARCQTTHLALLIISKLGQKSPSLATDLEARPAPLPVMSGGGDHSERGCGGSPHRDHCQPSSCRERIDASSSRASESARWVFTLCQHFPGLASLS
jgi:hypothetical protein